MELLHFKYSALGIALNYLSHALSTLLVAVVGLLRIYYMYLLHGCQYLNHLQIHFDGLLLLEVSHNSHVLCRSSKLTK